MQQLAANGVTTCYWTPGDAYGEIEFVTTSGDGSILPIEVKSGENVKSKSLRDFMKNNGTPLGIRISGRQFGREGTLLSIPLYAAFCVQPDDLAG